MVLPNADPLTEPNSDPIQLPPGTTNPVPTLPPTINNMPWPGNPTTLYEYRTLWYGNDIAGGTMQRLNALGREGWHVVAEADNRLILERPLAFTLLGEGDEKRAPDPVLGP